MDDQLRYLTEVTEKYTAKEIVKEARRVAENNLNARWEADVDPASELLDDLADKIEAQQAEINDRLEARLAERDAAQEEGASAALRSAFDIWFRSTFTTEERMTNPALFMEQRAAFHAGWEARGLTHCMVCGLKVGALRQGKTD